MSINIDKAPWPPSYRWKGYFQVIRKKDEKSISSFRLSLTCLSILLKYKVDSIYHILLPHLLLIYSFKVHQSIPEYTRVSQSSPKYPKVHQSPVGNNSFSHVYSISIYSIYISLANGWQNFLLVIDKYLVFLYKFRSNSILKNLDFLDLLFTFHPHSLITLLFAPRYVSLLLCASLICFIFLFAKKRFNVSIFNPSLMFQVNFFFQHFLNIHFPKLTRNWFVLWPLLLTVGCFLRLTPYVFVNHYWLKQVLYLGWFNFKLSIFCNIWIWIFHNFF